MDAYTFLILDAWAICWSLLGINMLRELWPLAPSPIWRAALVPFLGPVCWALLLYRGWRRFRTAVLHHYHLPDCGCCH
jgi:hypothetical protein